VPRESNAIWESVTAWSHLLWLLLLVWEKRVGVGFGISLRVGEESGGKAAAKAEAGGWSGRIAEKRYTGQSGAHWL
jgi:hypothetical protein